MTNATLPTLPASAAVIVQLVSDGGPRIVFAPAPPSNSTGRSSDAAAPSIASVSFASDPVIVRLLTDASGRVVVTPSIVTARSVPVAPTEMLCSVASEAATAIVHGVGAVAGATAGPDCARSVAEVVVATVTAWGAGAADGSEIVGAAGGGTAGGLTVVVTVSTGVAPADTVVAGSAAEVAFVADPADDTAAAGAPAAAGVDAACSGALASTGSCAADSLLATDVSPVVAVVAVVAEAVGGVVSERVRNPT